MHGYSLHCIYSIASLFCLPASLIRSFTEGGLGRFVYSSHSHLGTGMKFRPPCFHILDTCDGMAPVYQEHVLEPIRSRCLYEPFRLLLSPSLLHPFSIPSSSFPHTIPHTIPQQHTRPSYFSSTHCPSSNRSPTTHLIVLLEQKPNTNQHRLHHATEEDPCSVPHCAESLQFQGASN